MEEIKNLEEKIDFKNIEGISEDIREMASDSMPSRGNGDIKLNERQLREMQAKIMEEKRQRSLEREESKDGRRAA